MPLTPRTVAGAVLAAGAGTRMGEPKAELVIDGSRLLDRAVAVLTGAGCAPVIAVVREGTQISGARAVVNPDPDRGMRSSLALAVVTALAVDPSVDALAVLLVDTPGIDVPAVRAVTAAWRPGRIAVGRYRTRRGTRRGHPTVMSPELWLAALEQAGPDEGARALLAALPHVVDEVEVAGDASDLDFPDDVTRWHARGDAV